MINDMRTDVEAQQRMLQDSEGHRVELQVRLTETSQQVREDTVAHQEYQSRLISDNDRLR